MYRWLCVCGLLLLIPAVAPAAALTLEPREIVITETGSPEWRYPGGEDAEASKKKELYDKYLGKPSALTNTDRDNFVKEVGDNRKQSFETGLNPFLLYKPDAKKDIIKYDADSLPGTYKPVGLKIGDKATTEERQQAMDKLGIVKVHKSGSGEVYEMGDGTFVRFDDVTWTYYFQKQAGLENRAKTEADYDDPEKYEKVVNEYKGEGTYTISSVTGNTKWGPDGETSFDPGVPQGPKGETPTNAAQQAASGEKGDVRMEIRVKLEGKLAVGPNLAGVAPTKDLKDLGDCDQLAHLYMEDYVPPLPKDPNSFNVGGFQPKPGVGDMKIYAFVIPAVKAYKGDRTVDRGSQAIDPNTQTCPAYGFPNPDHANYTWQELMLKAENPQDDTLRKTLNYEVGMSLYNRVKLVDKANPADKNQHKYLYYIAPRPTPNGQTMGPYLGKVKLDSHQEVGFSIDPYSIDHAVTAGGKNTTSREYYEKFYQPVNFSSDADLQTLCYKVAGLAGDPGEKMQTGSGYKQGKYQNLAGISVKWNRECVQGITLGGGNSADPALKMPEYTMMLPFGFTSYQSGSEVRYPSFEAQLEPEKDPGTSKKSLVGTVSEGTAAADSFFKINAADCCSNDVVIASGTYGTEDNIKPIPYVMLREKDVRAGFTEPLKEVATVPNGLTGAGDPLGEYNYDIPESRIHDATVPLYGTGSQGSQIKGYGNYSNNAEEWDGRSPVGTLINPKDRKEKSFLECRLADNEPPIEEDRRVDVTITADDNVAPAVDLPSDADQDGRVRYSIAYLAYKFYYNETKGAPLGEPIYSGTILNLDPSKKDDPGWEREPVATFEYNFRKPGEYVIEVIAIDRNNNQRTMRVPVQVAKVGRKFSPLDLDTRRENR